MRESTDTGKFKVGDTITVAEFGFINKHGGTGKSDWDYNEKFFGPAELKITKVWYDYETGVRGWAEPINSELQVYLKRNAKQEDKVSTPELWDEETYSFKKEELRIPANTVFWSEHDVA
jgi:hypothetical protein